MGSSHVIYTIWFVTTNKIAHIPFVKLENLIIAFFGTKEGPPITFIPFPVKDKNRPFNASNCSTCQERAGHFMQPQQIVENFMNGLQQQVDVQHFKVRIQKGRCEVARGGKLQKNCK